MAVDKNKLIAVHIDEKSAAELRQGNTLRMALCEMAGRVLEIVITPTWEPGAPTNNNYTRAINPDPMYRISSEWVGYSMNADDPAKDAWRGESFGIATLADILAS